MPEGPLEAFEFKGPKPRTIGILVILLIVFIFVWGAFVIVPAGHRGVVLWWGEASKRGSWERDSISKPHGRKGDQGRC